MSHNLHHRDALGDHGCVRFLPVLIVLSSATCLSIIAIIAVRRDRICAGSVHSGVTEECMDKDHAMGDSKLALWWMYVARLV